MTRQSSLALARLGLPALPLAFVALPLYMVWPHHVATSFGLSLGLLGGLLFVVRLLDGLLDPLIGHAVDGLLNKGGTTLLRRCLLAGLVLALSFIWLFFPQWLLGPTLTMDALLVLLSVLLLCAYLAYSFLNIALQAWGAGIAGDHTERSRLVGWREGLGLLGVISASVGLVVGTAPHRGRCRQQWFAVASIVAALGSYGLSPLAASVHAERHRLCRAGHFDFVFRARPFANEQRANHGVCGGLFHRCGAVHALVVAGHGTLGFAPLLAVGHGFGHRGLHLDLGLVCG